MKEYGCSSEVAPIVRLLLKHPTEAFVSDQNVQAQWAELGYRGPPDFHRAVAEYDRFVELLEQHVPEILYLPRDERTGLDSVYVHDPLVMTPDGAVLCRMGKAQRRGEPEAMQGFLSGLGIPILGAITGEGQLEGGDVVILDRETLAVGEGYRTNSEGIRQLAALTHGTISEIQVVPLPHWRGPGEVLHLMSLVSPVDHGLLVVYERLLPVRFRNWLLERGYRLIDVPDDEFESMACNVLAVSPGRCVMLEGNPKTRRNLEKAGVVVMEYRGEEISRKGAGGPTCLTRPLLRAG